MVDFFLRLRYFNRRRILILKLSIAQTPYEVNIATEFYKKRRINSIISPIRLFR